MSAELFLLVLAAGLLALLRWGFRTLPQEGWQIAASVPVAKDESGHWHGMNLTYYGVFQASAYALAVALLFVLMGAVGIPPRITLLVTAILLGLAVPAATLVARLVERKPATFTVGGAVFVVALLGPWALLLANRAGGGAWGLEIPVGESLAAAAIAYALGEGVGRLACVSFGCCYGRPVADLPPGLRRLFARWSFVFAGPTKKIAYEGGLEGKQVVPIQGLTAIVLTAIALLGAGFFLHGYPRTALGVCFAATQIWRLLSETLRADHRGAGTRFSAYQGMALAGALYLLAGLTTLWNPTLILCLQGLWLGIFLHTGRSVVTGARLSFHVRRDMI